MTLTYYWRTLAIRHETADTITIIFDNGNDAFTYQAGQFIQLTLMIEGVAVTRSYSLSSSPATDAHPAITVKRVAGGLMSNHILDQAAHIQEWQVNGPHGSFTPDAHTIHCKQVVLMAGGSGITPLFSIARTLLQQQPHTHITLIYASKDTDNIIFRDALATYNERLRIHHALSQSAETPDNNVYIKGRLNKLVVRKLIKAATTTPQEDVHYFLCGPAALMNMQQEILQSLQVPEERIFREYFMPEEPAAPVMLPDTTQEVLLHFHDQSNLLEVHPGQSILSAALQDRIELPYSCKGGTCGICAARLTSGKVNMVQNYALRPEAISDGMILLCQSYPLTADVTVEIG